jgi:hypothetical protein
MTHLEQRVARTIQHYGFSEARRQAWTGPVVRRDPAAIRQQSVHETWVCANEWCRQWTMNGAYRTGRCNFCQTPRPT